MVLRSTVCQWLNSRSSTKPNSSLKMSAWAGSRSCSCVPISAPRRRTHGIFSLRWFQTRQIRPPGTEHPRDLGQGAVEVEPVEGLRGDHGVHRAVGERDLLGTGDGGANARQPGLEDRRASRHRDRWRGRRGPARPAPASACPCRRRARARCAAGRRASTARRRRDTSGGRARRPRRRCRRSGPSRASPAGRSRRSHRGRRRASASRRSSGPRLPVAAPAPGPLTTVPVVEDVAGIERLEGVGSAYAATRDGIDTLLRDRGLRQTSPDLTTESLLRGAHATAVLEGSGIEPRRRPRRERRRASPRARCGCRWSCSASCRCSGARRRRPWRGSTPWRRPERCPTTSGAVRGTRTRQPGYASRWGSWTRTGRR